MTSNKYLEGDFPPTYLVVEFGGTIQPETAQWLVNKISSKKINGGAQLELRQQPKSHSKNVMIHVSCKTPKLLELAEELEVRKKDRYGVMREFTVDELDEFIDPDEVDSLLTTAEKQVLVRHELENIRALSHEICILGYSQHPLYEGQSIIAACLLHGIIRQIYPIHDDEEVKKLGHSWYMRFLADQPFERIKIYFGESITLYFQFLGFYTKALVIPTILGFLQMILYPGTLAFFCLVNVICASLFLELWRRKCSELAYMWGTISMTSFDEPRPNFRGVMGKDAVTGKILPQSPRFRTHIRMYCVSMPLVLLCLIGAFGVMLFYFWVEDCFRSQNMSPLMISLPGIVYAVLIYIMNLAYRRLANYLTEWENHRTQSQFDRHRVTKLVLFEFVNNFMSLFYIAFYIQDMDLLRYQLATLLIVLQAINNIQEAVVPLIFRKYFIKQKPNKNTKKYEKLGKVIDLVGVKEIDPEDNRVEQVLLESQLDVYEDPYDDYLELFVQFGYVFLFSAVYPMAAFWAFANNFIEIRTDAFKLCQIYQRPMPRKVKDTGAWQRSFQVLCALSVMTNCLLLSLSPTLKEVAPDMKPTSWLLMFVFIEHFLHALRLALHYAIPDKPEWVRVALAKGNYQSKQALKLQRQLRHRKKTEN